LNLDSLLGFLFTMAEIAIEFVLTAENLYKRKTELQSVIEENYREQNRRLRIGKRTLLNPTGRAKIL